MWSSISKECLNKGNDVCVCVSVKQPKYVKSKRDFKVVVGSEESRLCWVVARDPADA